MQRVKAPVIHILDHPVPFNRVTVGFAHDPQVKADNAAVSQVVVTTRCEVGRPRSKVLKIHPVTVWTRMIRLEVECASEFA